MESKPPLISSGVEQLVIAKDYLPKKIFEIDLVYSKKTHPLNSFGQLYSETAEMLIHKQFLPILLDVGEFCFDKYKWKIKLYDCFRPYEAQVKMLETSKLPKSLLARPGGGGHVRGLAIDLQPLYKGKDVNMGCHFDDFSNNGISRANRFYLFENESHARRNVIMSNRYKLDLAFRYSSDKNDLPVYGLSTEWWDYRVPNHLTSNVEPMYNKELPAHMNMMY